MRLHPLTPLFRAAIIASRSVARVALLGTLAACGARADASDPFALGDALESAPIAPRLSVATAFRACPEAAPRDGTILRARCPAPPARTAARLAEAAARARRAADDPAALHALALVDLVADDSTGRALERAIAALRQSAALAERPAAALADLSAALIVRAERTQAPRDLLEAYETAEQALRLDPRSLAALYNRALALDRFGLVDETAKDWQAYLGADSTSGWADDARRRRQAALSIRPPAPPRDDAPLSAYPAYAAADPQGARELGMDRLLAEWGAAVDSGDAPRAADRLRRAAALADALERRPGGDASLADMVRAIQATAPDPAATRALARAHREYGAGVQRFDLLDYAGAQSRFAAAGGAGASPALQGWARVFGGTTLVQLGARGAGERLLGEAANADTLRYRALAARARWSLGRTVFANERWDPALNGARQSARLFARAGERENEGAALNLAGDIHFLLGEPDSGYAVMHRGYQQLRPYRASLRLHNLLAGCADAIATDGLHASALRLLGEDVAVATRTGHPAFAAEARLKRARHLARSGDRTRSRADLEPARTLVQQIDSGRARRWFAIELREVEAVLSLRADPGSATQELDSAAAYYARVRYPFRVLPALVGSAEARLAAGDGPGALRRLESAVRLLDQRRDSIGMEPRRAAVFDAARGVVDRLVLLTLAEGREDDALRYMDRARASLSSASPGRRTDDYDAGALDQETAVEYARIADTLLAWTVSSGRVQGFRTVVDTIQLARTIRELENQFQRGASEAEVRPSLSLLYDWLIRPVQTGLGSAEPLVVVADGEIAAVPFAALYDSRRDRYLVEERPIRFAVSLREARRKPARDAADRVVLVADPAHARREHPLLERLTHARQEVRTIGMSYPGAEVLAGAQATRPAMESALEQSGVVHFAGHAVFDDQRPERSYLVLAPAPGGGGGRITASELARLDLHRVRLVVLSACRTVRSGTSRAGGFAGLSGALLAAGAGGAVGSTWEVDDRATAALMAQFHGEYSGTRDGPGALRAAQLALLRSSDPALRTPSAWAGFRYAGR
ncbi:MAG TPA: CHAT domain-containing protein [Longimicrobium sp.]|nr:CHAT domain-containing protein [Longimicrobium sp.]